jgi:hypothetical protein
MFNSVVVLPVPGGPNILNTLALLPAIYLLDSLLRDAEVFSDCRHRHKIIVNHVDDLRITAFAIFFKS